MNKELPANTTLSHYRTVDKIDAGGMGEVYLAQDTKVDRKSRRRFSLPMSLRTMIEWSVYSRGVVIRRSVKR